MKKIEFPLGTQFGRLITISESYKPEGKHRRETRCRCECGNEISVYTTNLMTGKTKSCGCIAKDALVKFNTKHLLTSNPLYYIHKAMISRCNNPNDTQYMLYGGIGIKVCDRWCGELGLVNFVADVSINYKKGLYLDRIDPSKDYCLENIRWSTATVSAHNKKPKRGSASGLLGVHWHKQNQCWIARITKDGNSKHLGVFRDKTLAAKAYDDASEELYGDRPNKTSKH